MTPTHNDAQILIQSMMQRNPLKLADSDTVRSAVDKMFSNHVSALPVVDDSECLIGIVSLKDLMPIAEARGSDKVVAVMTEAPVTVELDDSLLDSARLMMQHQVHHLPVVGKDKRLVGVVSSIDFVRLAADGMLRATS
jgi:CBS domain-containing protein